MTVATTRPRGSSLTTRGFRVEASPAYLPENSRPEQHRWVFGYRIRVTNTSPAPAQLLGRHWTIVDADGERHDVSGEGVVGQQPRLEPGATFEYESFCPLQTPWGTMEGEYTLKSDTGETFAIGVARFFLVSEGAK